MEMLARFHNMMGRETINTLQMLTEDITEFFSHDIMVDRIAAMLNYFLVHLVSGNYLLYPRTKSGILWFWSRQPPETVWFPEATDHNFEGIVFICGIHLWGVKVSPPIKNGQGRVISPGVGGQKPPKLSTFSYFSLFSLKIFCLIHLFGFI
jgi:hypothetical protein